MDLRIKNILDAMFGGSSPSPTYPMGAPSINQGNLPQMNNSFEPSYNAENQLQQMLMTMPQRSDYEPSKGRQILGAVAGMGTGHPGTYYNGQPIGYESNIPAGMKVQEQVNYAPYYQKLDDWSTGLKPLSELADAEAQRNTNERIIQNNTAMQESRNREIGRKEQKDEDTANYNQDRLKVSQQRANTQEYKVKHPNHIYKEDDKGLVYSIDPATNETDYILDADGDPIKSSNLTDEQKLNLQLKNRLTEISATGNQTRQTEGLKHTNDLEEIKARGDQARETKKIPSSSTVSGKSTSATQKKQELINKANEMISKDADVGKYLQFDNTGVKVKPSSYWLDDKKRMSIYNELFGQAPIPSHESTNSKSTGKIRVKRKTDGKTGTIDSSDFDAKKYERIE